MVGKSRLKQKQKSRCLAPHTAPRCVSISFSLYQKARPGLDKRPMCVELVTGNGWSSGQAVKAALNTCPPPVSESGEHVWAVKTTSPLHLRHVHGQATQAGAAGRVNGPLCVCVLNIWISELVPTKRLGHCESLLV